MTKNYNIANLGDSWAWGEWSWVGDKITISQFSTT